MMVNELMRGPRGERHGIQQLRPHRDAGGGRGSARAFWGDPPLTQDGLAALTSFATTCLPAVMAAWQQRQYRAVRQNALRQLMGVSPDLQTS